MASSSAAASWAMHEQNERVYWHCASTGESRWEPPWQAFTSRSQVDEATGAPRTFFWNAITFETTWEPPVEVDCAWQRLKTADGDDYEYNHILKITRWTQAEKSKRRSIKLAKRLSGLQRTTSDFSVEGGESDVRAKVLEEIIDTEVTYNKNMHILLDVFSIPLQSSCGPNKAQTIRPLFVRARAITAKSDALLRKLKASDAHPVAESMLQCVSDPEFTKAYSEYASGLDPSMDAINSLEKESTAFAEALEKCNSDQSCKGLTLQSFLIMPVQRVPRYKLLLKELLKRTKDQRGGERGVIELALDTVSRVATTINESIRERENYDKLVELQNSLVGAVGPSIISKNRKFIRQGTLMRICKRKAKPMEFILFSDILMYGTPRYDGQLRVHRRFALDTCNVRSLGKAHQVAAEFENAFQVASPVKSFIAYGETAYERDQWVKDIDDCISHLGHQRARSMTSAHRSSLPRGSSAAAPVWIPDSLALHCAVCETGFWMLLRKHHCRVCGKVVCAKCSETRKLLPAIDPKAKVRVCDSCEGLVSRPKKAKSSKNLLKKLLSVKKTGSKKQYFYLDDEGKERGPYSSHDILNWYNLQYMGPFNKVRVEAKGSEWRNLKDVVSEWNKENRGDEMDARKWVFRDDSGAEQGPYTKREMQAWRAAGYFGKDRLVKMEKDVHFVAYCDSTLAKR